ncbi:MAG: right-handed parallel beta-helix repeat-containing protein [Promethearchaeota archaeon]
MRIRELRDDYHKGAIISQTLVTLVLLLFFAQTLSFQTAYIQKIDYQTQLIQDSAPSNSLKPSDSNLIRRADAFASLHAQETADEETSFINANVTQTYIDHVPIYIDGNADFLNQSESENWPGNGTVEDPIIISGYNISNVGETTLLVIRNTDLYFQVSSNLFTGFSTSYSRNGLSLNNVTKGTINNNIFQDVYVSIKLRYSDNNNITNNIITNSFNGIYLWTYCYNNNLINNTVSDGSTGIHLSAWADYNILVNNTIQDFWLGIDLGRASNNILTNNIVVRNTNGIGFDRASNSNTITNNTIASNTNYGISFNYWPDDYPKNNVVKWNDFILNNLDDSQAYDNASNTLFTHNFWDEWLEPDNDSDGIVDNPYNIDGKRNNQDLWPLVEPNNLYNSPLTVSYSYNERIIILSWSMATYPFRGGSYSAIYSIYYSNDSGITWSELASELTGSSFQWDTSTLSDGYYQVKVVANCSAGFTTEGISSLIIHNNLSPPTVLNPNGGETLTGMTTINWTVSDDAMGHTVTYSVFYSSDSGGVWTLLATSLNTTGYDWDTTTVPNGNSYLIKVETTCSEGLTIADLSDSTFSIYNFHMLSLPTILSPNGGEVLTGMITIEWTTSDDEMGHTVTYSVFYSSDSGETWTILATDLVTSSYDWDTTTVPNGNSHLIKVEATCSFRITVKDLSDSAFSIKNSHILSLPTIFSPNGGEVLTGMVMIEWIASDDEMGHTVTYTVFYSRDGGETWNILITNLVTSSYEWDTKTVANGNNFLIKVEATCSEGLITVDLSDSTFSIQNYNYNSPTKFPLVELIVIIGLIAGAAGVFFFWSRGGANDSPPYPDLNRNSNLQLSSSDLPDTTQHWYPKFCTYCGSALLPDSIFCTQCGSKIEY